MVAAEMKRLLPLLALVASLPLRGSAETTLGTAITDVPYIITKPGIYHLTKDLGYTASGLYAIKIEATDVVIDLVDLTTNNVAVGIDCAGENRVSIEDGTIHGFQAGVLFVNASYCHISDLLITNSLETGISVTGNHTDISHNRISDTGDSAVATMTYSVGIALSGTDGSITGNDIENTFVTDVAGHGAEGIRLRGCINIIVSNNRVLDVEPSAPAKGGASTGIQADPTVPSSTLAFLGNIVLTGETGFDFTGATAAKYGDNITESVSSTYLTSGTSATDIGGNN
jgi:hypothetical protein